MYLSGRLVRRGIRCWVFLEQVFQCGYRHLHLAQLRHEVVALGLEVHQGLLRLLTHGASLSPSASDGHDTPPAPAAAVCRSSAPSAGRTGDAACPPRRPTRGSPTPAPPLPHRGSREAPQRGCRTASAALPASNRSGSAASWPCRGSSTPTRSRTGSRRGRPGTPRASCPARGLPGRQAPSASECTRVQCLSCVARLCVAPTRSPNRRVSAVGYHLPENRRGCVHRGEIGRAH